MSEQSQREKRLIRTIRRLEEKLVSLTESLKPELMRATILELEKRLKEGLEHQKIAAILDNLLNESK